MLWKVASFLRGIFSGFWDWPGWEGVDSVLTRVPSLPETVKDLRVNGQSDDAASATRRTAHAL